MARATVLVSNIWGIITDTIIQGDGLAGGPSVSSVTVGDPNTIRVVFDCAMMQDGYLLRIDNYLITKTSDPSSILMVFRTLPVSGRQDAVDLIVQDQEAVLYDFLAGVAGVNAPIRDAYGNILVNGAATFIGQAPATIAYSELYAFAGFEAGMDVKTETGWDPDLDPPYLANQIPFPGQFDIGFTPDIWLDIIDDTSGVNESSVWIKVDGAYAWLLSTAQPGFTVTRTTIANGYRYKIRHSAAFPGAHIVLVEVHADDLAAIPNTLSTSYWFRTIGDTLPPFLYNRDPVPDAGGIVPGASFSFDVLDDYSGVVPESLVFYVDGAMAYDGVSGNWHPPYDGYVGRVEDVVDGYDGYHARIDHPTPFPASARVNIRVVARDVQGNVLDETYGFWISPALVSVFVDPYETTLRLVFSGDMEPSSLLDASLFRLSGRRAYVRKVDILDAYEARLWVEWFQGEGPFALAVSDMVRDIHDGYLIGAGASLNVFQSDAMFTNTDGLVRSWHDSRLLARDGQRIYMAGMRGIDVFDDRFGIPATSRWGQVLDSYGINAICLVKSGDGYEFFESDPPQLRDQFPAPDTTVPSPGAVLFSVVDNITAVETVSLAVYVGGTLVFSGGSGGWMNNWGGQITVRQHRLDVELYPPSPFAPGTRAYLRVLASDMLGNIVDRTYAFNIAP